MTMPSTNPSTYLRSLIFLFVVMASFHLNGQVTGNTNVNANSTHTYQLNKGVVYPFPNWVISGGTEQSSWNIGTTYYVSAKWDGATSNGTVVFTSTGDFLYVTIASVAPPKPNNPTITSNGCGQAVLQRNGSPPSGVTWYWQGKNNNGQITNKGSGSTFIADEGSGTYYIQARNSSGQWSSSSGSRYVSMVNLTGGSIATSGNQVVCYNGNPTILSNETSAGGISGSYTYQWQRSSNGSTGWTNVSGATSTSYDPPSGQTQSWYYRRRVTCGAQTQYSLNTVQVAVHPDLMAGSIGSVPDICEGGNPLNIPSSSSPSGGNGSYTYQWQYSNNGSTGWTNISGATASSYNPPGNLGADRWYRRGVSSCGQTKYTAGTKVDVIPDPSMPSAPGIANNCGNTVLTRSNPPQNITWHWQSSELGEDTSGSSTNVSKTFNSSGTYYLRGRNSVGCWGPARTINYTVDQPTTWYADTDGDGKGNSAVSTSECTQPSGYVANSSDHDDTTVMITDIAPQTYYSDVDGDGFGASGPTISASFKPLGYADNTSDQCPEVSGSVNGCDYVAPTLSDKNRIYTRTYQTAMTSATGIEKNSDVLENVAYFDGLGRPQQQIAVRGSGTATRAASPNTPAEWTMDWSVGTGGTPFFNRNGTENENERFYGPNPFGETDLIWRCGNEPDSGSDGGWNTDYINVDKTKTYRYMVWVRRDGSQNGSTYHGTQNVEVITGGNRDNPYFWSGDLPQLGEWYLLVGIVHPYTHGSTDTGVSGVYDINGNQVIDRYEYKWRSDTTTARFRSYFYYSTDVNTRQYFYRPILEVVDGNEIPLQEMFQSGRAEDIVTHVGYDDYGRQDKEWLPYHEPTGNSGSYRGDVSTVTKQYYLDNFADDFPGLTVANVNAYSQKELEASPLSRVLEQGAPGKDWKLGEGNEIGFGYKSNIASEVRRYKVTLSFANNTYTPTLVADGYYAANELYKNVTEDENWTSGTDHTTEEFTDKQGRVVLKRTHNNGDHDTYYIYDNFGNLTYVLPPKVVHDASISATELSELCYQYVYDHRNRLVEKRIPGKGWEYIVYNLLDQPVMTQDANLDAQNKWLFTKYDAFGRVAYTGLVNSSSSRTTLQDTFNGLTTSWVSQQTSTTTIAGTDVFYDNGAYPTSIAELHTVNYYDSYVDTDGLSVPSSVLGQSTASGNALKGLATVSKTRILGTSDWTTTITGYDLKNRPIYTASRNDYLNITDVVETQLDFAGRPEQTVSSHTKDGSAAIVTTDNFTYDHMGRLLKQEQTLGGSTETIVENTYDGIGQLITKETGGGLQTVDYGYNVRGWLTSVNDVNNLSNDLFAFKANYNRVSHGATPQYIQNVAEAEWKTANDNTLRWYGYGYDALYRLEGATSHNGNYNVSMSYDKMGNIQNLTRNGWQNSSGYTNMDVLGYAYQSNSNKLLKVTDTGNRSYGFKEPVTTVDDYEYDANLNMTVDRNKGITGITYNHLNMPTGITVNGNGHNGTINFTYDANGAKLRKEKTEGGVTTTTDYIGNYVYENGNLKQITHPEGYIEPDGSSWQYVYRLVDIWGNTRITYADDNNDGSIDPLSEIRREQNYYPGGLEHKGYNGSSYGVENNLKTYQAQEFTNDLGLDFHEWRYRASYPDIVRFWQVDPLAEDYMYNSTFAFQENKFGMGVELEGLELGTFPYINPVETWEATKGVGRAVGDEVVGLANMVWDNHWANPDMWSRTGDAVTQLATDPQGVVDNAVATVEAIPENVNNAVEGIKSEWNSGTEGKAYAITTAALIVLDPSPAGEMSATARTAKALNKVSDAKSVGKTTDFVVTSNGTTIPIPDGATGPTSPQRGSGMMYQGGSGGKGMNGRTTGVRIMDANANQGRRVNYMNRTGQTVDPSSGRTISNKDPRGHIPIPIDPNF